MSPLEKLLFIAFTWYCLVTIVRMQTTKERRDGSKLVCLLCYCSFLQIFCFSFFRSSGHISGWRVCQSPAYEFVSVVCSGLQEQVVMRTAMGRLPDSDQRSSSGTQSVYERRFRWSRKEQREIWKESRPVSDSSTLRVSTKHIELY